MPGTNPVTIQDANTNNQAAVSVAGVVKMGLASFASGNSFLEATAVNVAALSGAGAQLVSPPGDFSVVSFPATATLASAVRAAGAAGVRHVCTGVSFGFSQPTTPVGFQGNIQILDGAAVIWQQAFASLATGFAVTSVNVTGLNLVGTAATSMTARFDAAGGTGTQESAVLMGHDVS